MALNKETGTKYDSIYEVIYYNWISKVQDLTNGAAG